MTLSYVETTCIGMSPCYPMTGTMIHTTRVYTHILHIALAPMYQGRRALLGVWCHVTNIVRIRDGALVYTQGAIGVHGFYRERTKIRVSAVFGALLSFD